MVLETVLEADSEVGAQAAAVPTGVPQIATQTEWEAAPGTVAAAVPEATPAAAVVPQDQKY